MKRQRKISLRKCIASQQMYPKKKLIRVVRTTDKDIVIDLTGKRSGRGAYLYANLENIEQAQKKKALEHALKVRVNPAIYDELRDYVKREDCDG